MRGLGFATWPPYFCACFSVTQPAISYQVAEERTEGARIRAAGTDLADLSQLEEILGALLGRKVDVVSYRGLDPILDQDILQDKVLL